MAILLLTSLLAVHGPTSGARATIDPGSIAGVVTDIAHHPLPGITVSVLVYNGSFLTVKGQDETNATGAYRIDDVAASPGYLVRFDDPNAAYATEYYDDSVAGTFATALVPVTAHQTTSGVDASLEPAATITGRLTTSTGAPVTSGQVRMWWHPPGYAIPMDTYLTDEAGQYTIDRVKAGTYYLDFYDPVTGAREFWNDQPGVSSYGMYGPSATVTPIVVAACESLSGVDAVFDGPAVPAPVVTCVLPPPPVAPEVTNVVRPRVKGMLEVGHVVRVSQGVWKPREVTLAYQWYAGGKAVTRATHRHFTLSIKYAGKRLSVRIKAKAAGYDRVVVWTKPTARVQP